MKKIIEIGRVKGEVYGYKRSLKVTVEVELRSIKKNTITTDLEEIDEYKVLSICGNVWNIRETDIVAGGQINDELREWVNNDLFKELYIDKNKLIKLIDIWYKYHLNDLHAGTKKQEEAIKKFRKENNAQHDFEKEVNYLKEIGLYDDRGYKYGTSWLYEHLPNDVIKFIENF